MFRLLLLLFVCNVANSQNVVVISDYNKIYKVGIHSSYLEDKYSQYTIENIATKHFIQTKNDVPSFFLTKSAYWIKFKLENLTQDKNFIINVEHATIDNITLYSIDNLNRIDSLNLGEDRPFHKRFYNYQTYLFNVNLDKGEAKTFYIKVIASEQLLVPISVGEKTTILENLIVKDLLFGMYVGLIFVMFFYNIFLYFSTNDSGYIYYVFYILFVGLSQAMLQGYTFRFLWPNFPQFNNYASVVIPVLNGVMAIEFVKHFLGLKGTYKKLSIGFNIILIFYVAALLFLFDFWAAQLLTQLAASAGSLYALIVCIILSRKGSRSAKILLVAWSLFLLSIIVFVLRNMGLVPYNNFTYYALQLGSSVQIILLSLALADKINKYREDEKAAREKNANLILEQNVKLEQQVSVRTAQLTQANTDLEETLQTLKNTQTQLVNNEKMSSLGQLTAGIAHEINNPINFVTSNIRPLKLDFEDLSSVLKKYEAINVHEDVAAQLSAIEAYKKQIDLDYVHKEVKTLLAGISEGAHRTAEIVRGLKNFARVDEDNLKSIDINEGLKSTLLLIRNSFPKDMQVQLDLDSKYEVECVPGKINQVFMNIISNAVHAIKVRHKESPEGKLSIKSWMEGNDVHVSIADNGTGMPESVKNKIYDPFFTTKDVGEGTGLGMSIVQGIIERHKGHINIETKENFGTEFIITLPKNQQAQ